MKIYLLFLIITCGCSSLDKYSNEKIGRQPNAQIPLLPKNFQFDAIQNVGFVDFINLTPYDTHQLNEKLFNFLKTKMETVDGINIVKLKMSDYYTDEIFDIEKLKNRGIQENVFSLISGIIEEITVNEEEKGRGILQSRDILLTAKVTYKYFDLLKGKETFSKTFNAEVREERLSLFNTSNSGSEFITIEKTAEKAWKEVKDIFVSLTTFGTIVEIDPPKYYVSFKKPPTALQINELLSVREKALGSPKGTLRVVELLTPKDLITIIETGSGFNVNDIVEFSTEKSY